MRASPKEVSLLDRLQISTFKIQYDKAIATCPNVATNDVIENLMNEREARSSENENDDYSRSSGGCGIMDHACNMETCGFFSRIWCITTVMIGTTYQGLPNIGKA